MTDAKWMAATRAEVAAMTPEQRALLGTRLLAWIIAANIIHPSPAARQSLRKAIRMEFAFLRLYAKLLKAWLLHPINIIFAIVAIIALIAMPHG